MTRRQAREVSQAALQKAQAEAARPDFRIACVETATETIGRLSPGARVIGLTKGQFSLLDLIRAVIAQTGPAHLVLSTWTFGIRDIENASWLLGQGDLLSVQLLTDRAFVGNQPAYCRRLVEVFGAEAIRATNTHAKFALIRNSEWDVSIRSSMNLNRNSRWEQFDLDADAEICDFFAQLVREMEVLMPPGPEPGEKAVYDNFHKALAAHSCGDVYTAQAPEEERLAALGYTRKEIAERLAAAGADSYRAGANRLDDQSREATISAANNGDPKALERVRGWVRDQKRGA